MLGMMRATMDASRDDALGPEMLRRESACIMCFCIYRILEVSLIMQEHFLQEVFLHNLLLAVMRRWHTNSESTLLNSRVTTDDLMLRSTNVRPRGMF
jgi:hypothetical protein